MQYVYSQLKLDVEMWKCGRLTREPSGDARLDGLSGDDLQRLFVKHRNGQMTFFCDLGKFDQSRLSILILTFLVIISL